MSGATNSPLNCRSSGKALLTVKSIISRLQTALEILQSRNSGQVRWRSSEFKALVTTLEGGIRSLNEKCGHTGIFSDPRIQYEDGEGCQSIAGSGKGTNIMKCRC